MNKKENSHEPMSSMVKSEPQEASVPSAPPSISTTLSTISSNAQVKPEPHDEVLINNANFSVPPRDMGYALSRNTSLALTESKKYTVYRSVDDVPYSSEAALREGMEMVHCLKVYMSKLTLGSKLRQDVWNRDLANLQTQSTPKTLIAVCGATGAGKSSILNALLEDNIVPTSGMRACTAVVTEIAHHNKRTIDADVSFLNVSEWKQELSILQSDLIEEDGSLKRTHDLKSDAGVAWQKVHAVYPTLTQERLVTMTANQIIAHDPTIAQLLGSTKHISARNSRQFREEIAKYIDSKDQSRGKKDKKDKKNDETLMDKVRVGASKKKDPNVPAFWPLIRQVNVQCPAECLSSGCVLVDLPGVADANAARNSIAKDYMKRAQCIWILAPITRAVDDKTARDLLGDAFKMQLKMASKTDDISCSEVISALHLQDDPELEAIDDEIERINDETEQVTLTKKNLDKAIKDIEKKLKSLRAVHEEHEEHIEALKNSQDFTPVLTAGAASETTNIKKRKNQRKGKKESSKRRCSSLDQDSEDDAKECNRNSDDSDSESESDSDSDTSDDEVSGSNHSERFSNEDGNIDIEAKVLVEEVTLENITAKMKQTKADIAAARVRLSDARKERKNAADRLAILEKSFTKVQKTKNGWCSLKRSEFSRDVLKEDFRTGLKELDDEAAEERDPDKFDSSVNQRDYEAINLPVFTCSSRDYIRLTNQVKGDGESTCFSDKVSTGIPDLQAWCHTLTVASRTRAIKNFYDSLRTFATNINSFVSGIGSVTDEDRQDLQDKWESIMDEEDEDDHHHMSADAKVEDDPLTAFLKSRAESQTLIATKSAKKNSKGITPRLNEEFGNLIQDCIVQLQELFKDGLEDKCRVGASLSANGAVEISDNFAATMHWATYRATLRRHGEFRRNLNVELLALFTKTIATSWSKVFETDLLGHFEETIQAAICRLLDDIVDSTAAGLKERVRMQGELCKAEADVALKQVVAVVRETINTQQKDVSRCLAPHVQNNLIDGYDLALKERGQGSVARQKLVFRTFLSERKDDVFDEGADVIMEGLSIVCSSVGDALKVAFRELAKRIEVNLAILWENVQGDPSQAMGRKKMSETIAEILEQAQLWLNAANKAKNAASTSINDQPLQDVDIEMK
ncbi:Dynamin family-domain-containing protein [Lentinula boryana]|uniref:Dynamin family-domain-containing protein n=1 Tax=Lentinula boryana TaxID=40481 RepID=A0ABQ8QMA4_9AGAR|nr:Dynamin family-domain-containing protein [Lentinula boryana]